MKPRKPLKIPLWTQSPAANWTESRGMERAIAVLKTEAALLRREGFDLQPKALLRVAEALKVSRGGATSEAESLEWARRDGFVLAAAEAEI